MKTSFVKAVANHVIKDDYSRQSVIAVPAAIIAVMGQMIRNAKIEDMYVFSEFMRGHLTNLADVALFTTLWNMNQMDISERLGFKPVSRPKTCAAMIMAIGVGLEMFQSNRRNAGYDWMDTMCYATSALAYLLTDSLLARKAKPEMLPDLPECKI